jgi:hypothetical protein
MKDIKSNHLLEILTRLYRAKVRYIVCGGVAVVLHGIERMTVDLDLALDFDPGNVKKFIKAIADLGLIPRVPISPEFLMNKKQRESLIREKNAVVFTFIDPDNPFKMIDVLLSTDKSYGALYKGSEIIKIGKIAVRIASKRQIIAMKRKVRPIRDKDRFDIRALQRIK